MTEVIQLQKDGSVIGISTVIFIRYRVWTYIVLCCDVCCVALGDGWASQTLQNCSRDAKQIILVWAAYTNKGVMRKYKSRVGVSSWEGATIVGEQFLIWHNWAIDAHSTIESILHWSFDFTESHSLVWKMIICYEPLRLALQSNGIILTICLHGV